MEDIQMEMLLSALVIGATLFVAGIGLGAIGVELWRGRGNVSRRPIIPPAKPVWKIEESPRTTIVVIAVSGLKKGRFARVRWRHKSDATYLHRDWLRCEMSFTTLAGAMSQGYEDDGVTIEFTPEDLALRGLPP